MATPLVSVGTPSHSYAYHGESVAGRRLSEMRIGADVSYRVDAISRNLSLNVLYTYAFVEKVLDIGTNRSNLSVDGHYQLGRKWEVAGFVAWQRTHGGLRVGAEGTDLVPPGEVNTPERFENHDRLLRENWTHIGTEASFRWGITRLFASYTYVVMGTDAHSGHALLGGIAVPFSFER